MGKQLFETCPTFRESILEFSELCAQHGLPPFLDMIKASDPNLKTMTPIQIQLGLVSLELALAMLWQSWGLVPDAVIGHSLGSIRSMCCWRSLSQRHAVPRGSGPS
jgi:acyl transferase domain-containing protein